MKLTLICDEIEEQVGVVNGSIADTSTFLCPPTHTLLTEAPPTVCPVLVQRVRTAADGAWTPRECLRGREGGEEGGSEKVVEGAWCSVVRKRLYAK